MKMIMKRILKRMLYVGGHRASPRRIRILFYHSIDDSGSSMSASLEIFERQMAFLKAEGYRALSMSDYLNNQCHDDAASRKSVLITFDDGFKSIYLHAFPILKRYGFTATIFLATDYIADSAHWISRDLDLIEDVILKSSAKKKDLEKIKQASGFPLLSWSEITEMSDYGIEFGSHTASHLWLGRTTREKAREDILRSKAVIGKILNRPVDWFSYPYSDYTPETKEIVRELGFRAACGGDPRVDRLPNDLYGIKRTGPAPMESFFEFKFIFSPAYDWYIGMIGRLRGAR